MKLNNKGFALTSIIYMLIVLFLMILLLILANLAQRKVVLDKIKNDVKENLNQGGVVASSNMIITFDPQGGQVSQTTKQVTYNETYGELPTPTKEGYKFVGWRGRNLFDKNSAPETDISYINGDGSKTIYGAYAIYKARVKPNTQYTITNSGKSTAPGYALYDENYNFITGAGYSNTANVTFTTPANASYIRFSVVANLAQTEEYRYDKDYFQLEEGNTATSYEPYQEYTSNTIVTKQENHTLYAVWVPLYTVTFDPNGGTLQETTKEVSYHEPYGNLPTPTREGYTFMGWNGKNLLDEQAIYENKDINYNTGEEYANGSWASSDYIKCLGNITYVFSYESDNSYFQGRMVFYDENKDYIVGTYINNSSKNVTYESPSNATYMRIAYSIKINYDIVKRYNLQLEEGIAAAEYEPYYITPSTTVVQEKNHTLKAIWKANE